MGNTTSRIFVSPTGGRVVDGTLDDQGWVLPLDIVRPRSP
jgi:hypothetical protein